MTMKKVTLNNEKCHQICLKKQSAPKITQKELTAWCEQELGAKVDQARHSSEHLNNESNPQQKKMHTVKCPELEHALQEWCLYSQGHIPLS